MLFQQREQAAMATGGARPKAPKVQRAATIATESARSQENSTTGEEIPKVQKNRVYTCNIHFS